MESPPERAALLREKPALDKEVLRQHWQRYQAGAEAIGVLIALLEGGKIPAVVEQQVRDVIARWGLPR